MSKAESDFLAGVATDLKAGKKRRVMVRNLLGAYGYKRRGLDVVALLRRRMKRRGLVTIPDFAGAPYGGFVNFEFDKQLTLPIDTAPAVKPADASLVKPVIRSAPAKAGPEALDWVALKPLNPFSSMPTPESGYRMLFRDFATYFDALPRVSGRLTVAAKGQNRFREDRDEFPFYIAVSKRPLGRPLNLEDHAYLLGVVAELSEGKVAPVASVEEEAPEPASSAMPHAVVDFGPMQTMLAAQLAGAKADIQGAVEASIAQLKVDLRAQIEEVRIESIRRLAAAQSSEALDELIEEEHGRFQEEIKAREDLLDEVSAEIRDLKGANDRLLAELDKRFGEVDAADAFATMEGTVLLFREMCKGNPVEVLPSAIRSAGECASKRRLEVLQFLLQLRELAIFLFCIRGTTAPFKEMFKRSGYDYAGQDSESTTNKYSDKRRFLIDGKKVLFEEHVTLFPNSPDCVQVYFRQDKEKQVLQVGYCGVHLPTVSR